MVGRPFPKGLSGNPGGRPPAKEFSALARRYAPDIIASLVEVLRLPARDFASQRVAAARELRIIGWPGLEKHGLLDAVATPGQMHLLAVQMTAAIAPNAHLTGEPADPEADEDREGWISAPDLLPAPSDDLPTEALPLWDAYKARRAAMTVDSDQVQEVETPDSPQNGPEGPDSGDFSSIDDGFRGFFDDGPESDDVGGKGETDNGSHDLG